jgi:hypothetical protein
LEISVWKRPWTCRETDKYLNLNLQGRETSYFTSRKGQRLPGKIGLWRKRRESGRKLEKLHWWLDNLCTHRHILLGRSNQGK